MKIRSIYILVITCILFSAPSIAQTVKEKEKPTLWDKMFVGGNLGLQFGTITDIEVSPHVGYRLLPWLSAGVGISYEYYNSKIDYPPFSAFETHIYGYNLFVQPSLIPDMGKTFGMGYGISIIGQVEYEQLSLERKYFEAPLSMDKQGRFWIDSFLVGGGIKQAVGRRSSVYMLLMWNLNETVNSPYNNPIFKFGFDF